VKWRTVAMNGATRIELYLLIVGAFIFGPCAHTGRSGVMAVALDLPSPMESRPHDFTEAIEMASGDFVVNLRLMRAIRKLENGRHGLEMGVGRVRPDMRDEHPVYTQAWAAARLLALYQRDWSAGDFRAKEFARFKFPFLAYACKRWNPAIGWKTYYKELEKIY